MHGRGDGMNEKRTRGIRRGLDNALDTATCRYPTLPKIADNGR